MLGYICFKNVIEVNRYEINVVYDLDHQLSKRHSFRYNCDMVRNIIPPKRKRYETIRRRYRGTFFIHIYSYLYFYIYNTSFL